LEAAATARRHVLMSWVVARYLTQAIAEEGRPVSDSGDNRMKSFTDRARSVLSNVTQDDRVKQATAVTKDVASRAGEASKTVTRTVSQQDAWDELRGDIATLAEIARADHALVVDLIDRVAQLEARAGTGPETSHDS
jgi:hypothetical protein